MTNFSLRWCAALLLVLGATQLAQAQVITDGNIENGLRFPGTPTFGWGEPYTQRYSYTTGAYIFINGDSRQIRYLDYLDRADRARKFGYAMPVDPYFPEEVIVDGQVVQAPPPPPPPAGRNYIGGGLGWFRRR
jgi:hypothetical protein